MTFVERALRVTFAYGTGSDGNGAPEITILEGLRMTARAVLAGGASMGQLDLRIYGMSLSRMNKLSTLGSPIATQRRNTVTLEAGDLGSNLAKIYEGTIFSAWADLNAAPNASFNVSAHTGLIDQMVPAAPSSFPGSVDAAQLMGIFAQKMGYTFENHGVAGIMLSNPAYNGSLREQAAACAQAAHIEWVIDVSTLAIWPKGGARGTLVAQIGPGSGMEGYPTYTANGLIVRALFDPRFRFGGLVEVNSAIPTSAETAVNPTGKAVLPVGGKWAIVTLTQDLACQFPGGPWHTEMMLVPPGYLVVPQAR